MTAYMFHGIALGTEVAGATEDYGFYVNFTEEARIVSVTKASAVTATTGYVLDSARAVLASATFNGNVARFAQAVPVHPGVNYILSADSGGGAYTSYRTDNTVSFPRTYDIFYFVAGYTGTTTWAHIGNLEGFNVEFTGTRGTKAINKNYPYTAGLTARTTKQTGRVMNLVPQSSIVSERERTGFT